MRGCPKQFSAPAEQIDSRRALVVCALSVPHFYVPDLPWAAAKRNWRSASARTNHAADWENLFAPVAETDHHTLELDSSPGNSECEGRKYPSVIDVDFVVIRSSIHASVSEVLLSADIATSTISRVTTGSTPSILAGQQSWHAEWHARNTNE